FKVITNTAGSVQKSAQKVAGELVPEKVVLRGLRQIKFQAKRPDMVGDAAKRTLKFFNRSFKTVARVATRFENASEVAPAAKPATTRPPARPPRRRAAEAHPPPLGRAALTGPPSFVAATVLTVAPGAPPAKSSAHFRRAPVGR